jgi:predicted Zn-dependent protease with MMP-like domain
MKLERKEFDKIVARSIRRIPHGIRAYLQNVLISVQNRPSHKLLKELGMRPDETLLGVYQGVSLMGRSALDPPLYPDTIILFQEPLEEACDTFVELEEQIEITVVHEIAHFVRISEESLTELGYE